MKDKTTMSKKHDKERHSHKRHDMEEADTYKHVLKERHCRDEERNKKKDRDKNTELKQSSHSHKSKRSNSPHRSSHYKSSSPSKSKKDTNSSNNRKNLKHKEVNDVNESYEELSRRKRKLESELRALDLEEAAAAKEAENKKAKREKPEKSRKTREELEPRVKKDPDPRSRREPGVKIRQEPDIKVRQEPDVKVKPEPGVRVKREHISDDERNNTKKASKNKPRHSDNKGDKDRHKKEEAASKSSEDEKAWGLSQNDIKKTDKEKPNFETSGKLAEETNTYNGVVIKYNEPSEARKPKRRWRLYPFKGDSDLPFIPIHRQSAYLFGRTRLIADIPIDHPSCSKQHAVLQFRVVPYKREDGTTGRRVRPYIIDLESSNGTFVNNNKVDPRCYVELVEKDVIKFGYSSREYVLLHEESKYNEEDDDILDTSD